MDLRVEVHTSRSDLVWRLFTKGSATYDLVYMREFHTVNGIEMLAFSCPANTLEPHAVGPYTMVDY